MFKRRKPEGSMGNDSAIPQHDPLGAAEGMVDDPVVLDAPRPSWPVDTGLGVPPYRPVPSKEAPAMARMPLSAPSLGVPSTPTPPPAPAPTTSLVAPPRPVPVPDRVREAPERRTLVVGRGISVQGTVADAERLVVEGTVEASMIHAAELSIAPGGVFKGEVEVEDAEIGGTIDGTLTVRGNLTVRATGKVLGTARCRRLQVEDGGQITGRIEMLTDGVARVEASRQIEAVG